MDAKLTRGARGWTALFLAVGLLVGVRAAARALCAALTGVWTRFGWAALIVRAGFKPDAVTDAQFGWLCLAGPLAVLALGYALLLLTKPLSKIKPLFVRALAYMSTVVFLTILPMYLSALYGFFGTGDMAGIALLLPQWLARVLFGALGVVNVAALVRFTLPAYRAENSRGGGA